jgi:hypothetical protein
MLGNEVALPAQGFMKAGNHEVRFNASSLPDGVYFYRLEAGSRIETKKMILKRD